MVKQELIVVNTHYINIICIYSNNRVLYSCMVFILDAHDIFTTIYITETFSVHTPLYKSSSYCVLTEHTFNIIQT